MLFKGDRTMKKQQGLSYIIRGTISELFEMANWPRCKCKRPYFKSSSYTFPRGHFFRCLRCKKLVTEYRVITERLVVDGT